MASIDRQGDVDVEIFGIIKTPAGNITPLHNSERERVDRLMPGFTAGHTNLASRSGSLSNEATLPLPLADTTPRLSETVPSRSTTFDVPVRQQNRGSLNESSNSFGSGSMPARHPREDSAYYSLPTDLQGSKDVTLHRALSNYARRESSTIPYLYTATEKTHTVAEKSEQTNYSGSSPPSGILDAAVASSNTNLIRTTLDSHFEAVATGTWSWLLELKELGYSNVDLAELLVERQEERPWIHFEPWILARSLPDRRFHINDCVHQCDRSTQTNVDLSWGDTHNTASDARSMRAAVASLCGLGGVVPSGGTSPRQWKSIVDFPRDFSAIVDYSEPGLDHFALLDRMIGYMNAFCTALDIVQRAKACCDTFTVLVTSTQHRGPNIAELRLVPIGQAVDFLRSLKAAKADLPGSLSSCDTVARALLEGLETPLVSVPVIHRCALAVQFLTVGLVSYCQAHVGGLEMFFLEEKLSSIRLAGAMSFSQKGDHGQYPGTSIHFRTQRLTCLDGMLGTPVMVFSRPDLRASMPECLDVLATAEGLLGTWGPGGMVINGNKGGKCLTMLTLRGGKVCSSGQGRFHWSLGNAPASEADMVTFSTDELLLIGAAVEVNPVCRCTEQECLAKCQSHYLPLGTVAVHMRQQAMEFGVQAGQYGIITFNTVLEKIPGVSLKEVVLDRLQKGQDYLSFLASSYGLQVSFCSGVARRVRMRDLLAEMLPVYFQRNLVPIRSWPRLQDHYHITEVLARGDIRDCLRLMYADDPVCFQDFWSLAFGLTRLLKETGLDLSNDTFTVAIIPSAADEPLRRVSFDAGRFHYWTRALRDTDTCATIAYFTLSCLQVGGRGCRSIEPNWHRQVLFLQTEVLRT
ncbi:hypothetical protein LTR27_009124 [Elasticomyces elasticus]|nr:hypothetical protein LTR27_009124 [Elasticomyces elasticus]